MGKKSKDHTALRRFALFGCAWLILLGCAQGNCRRKETEVPAYPGQKEIIEGKGRPVLSEEEKAKRVFVYKYDGSAQCGLGKSIPVAEMAKELKGIKILSMVQKSDGLMRIQMCGSPTGMANVFEIYKTEKAEAEKRGFKVWEHN